MCKSEHVKKHAPYFRKSDQLIVHRFRCIDCGKTFSDATGDYFFAQKKRHLNQQIHELLAMGTSQNGIARHLKIARTTVVRTFRKLGTICAYWNYELKVQAPKPTNIQFDEMETFEHTLCKPLSISLAVDKPSRRIMGFNIAIMPANGPLAMKSVKKYGKRPDLRIPCMTTMFQTLMPHCSAKIKLESDMCPRYAPIVKRTFGVAGMVDDYKQYKGRRSAATGQGELKKGKSDPLFYLNHTCAMLRANVNRLIRKTWCTTKMMARLVMHLDLYTYYHNNRILLKKTISDASIVKLCKSIPKAGLKGQRILD